MATDMELIQLSEIANKAADAAGEVVRKHYSNNATRFQFREKDGDGPVTRADVEAEQAIVSVILDAFPSHSIYGEETGWHNRDNAPYNDDAKRAYDSLSKKVGKRLFNGNCIVFGELASGFADVVVDCALDPYDFLALVPVVEGAGGIVTDWEGRELLWNASTPVPEGGFKIVATAGKNIHQHVISALSH
ncbi:bifunctional phosphatase IMPL2, chloroplastic-like [Nicotiana tabacum]|uniref:Bifunctional phosphatase IMPL2, chloroplastic-like n=1 Tax=Nicotiana tabacum TaxID=4097 RepID=A0AC58TDW4_TOBAC